MRALAAAFAVLLVLTVLAGCAGVTPPSNEPLPGGPGQGPVSGFVAGDPPTPDQYAVPPPDPMAARAAPDAADAKPGVYPLPGDRSQVIGTLQWGTVGPRTGWYVLARYPWEPLSDRTRVIAFLTASEPSDWYGLNDRYVTVDGKFTDAGSLTMQPGRPPSGVVSGSFAWARLEKPNVTRLPDGTLRAVGQLAYVRAYRGAQPNMYAVTDGLPGAMEVNRVNAFLRTSASDLARVRALEGRYVAVQGPQVGTVIASDPHDIPSTGSSTPWPVVSVGSISVVTTPTR